MEARELSEGIGRCESCRGVHRRGHAALLRAAAAPRRRGAPGRAMASDYRSRGLGNRAPPATPPRVGGCEAATESKRPERAMARAMAAPRGRRPVGRGGVPRRGRQSRCRGETAPPVARPPSQQRARRGAAPTRVSICPTRPTPRRAPIPAAALASPMRCASRSRPRSRAKCRKPIKPRQHELKRATRCSRRSARQRALSSSITLPREWWS